MGKNYNVDPMTAINNERLMNTSFFRGFMNDRVGCGMKTFIKPFGPMAFNPSSPEFVSTVDVTNRQNKIAETITAAEWAILTDTNITSSKADIIRYVEILQKLITAGVFDKCPPDINAANGPVWVNPNPWMYGGPTHVVPENPFTAINGNVQPVYGCPVQSDIIPKDADVWEQIEKAVNADALSTETIDTDKVDIFNSNKEDKKEADGANA